MASPTGTDRARDVAAGDVISLADGRGPYRVVHVDAVEAGCLLTLESDGGETVDVELPGDAAVTRTLESKWESAQSPTPHAD